VWRILNKFFITFEYFMDNLGEEHVLPVLSVIGTVLFILVVGYFMSYLVKKEEENIQAKQNRANNNNNGKLVG
jgi:DnaJ homolog subfamily C member 16